MNYIIIAFLIISICSFFGVRAYSKKLISKANPEILNRILTNSNGSIKGNETIKQQLLTEEYGIDDIDTAINASIFVRHKKNILLAPLFSIIACIYLLIRFAF